MFSHRSVVTSISVGLGRCCTEIALSRSTSMSWHTGAFEMLIESFRFTGWEAICMLTVVRRPVVFAEERSST